MSAARPVPVILSERLRLRAHEADDFDTLVALWHHPDTVRFIGGGKPRPPNEVWTNMLRNRGLWQMLGYGYWLVEERKSGAFVGEVGFADFHRDTEPKFWGVPECGWIITPEKHGQGYASEAVAAIHDWLDDELGAGKSVCIIDHDNHASIRIAQKLDYIQKGSIRFKEEDVCFFERTSNGRNV